MIRTAIENDENLIVEGLHIPFGWKNDFAPRELDKIRCLVMSGHYIRTHFAHQR